MKKSFLLISLAALMFLFSCKKDDSSVFDVPYTDETPEQSKENVELNAIALVNQLDNLSSATGIEVMMHLNQLQSAPAPLKSTQSNPVLEPLSLIGSLNDKNSVSQVFNRMKVMEELMAEDPMSFSALFDSIVGKYTYNFSTGEFDETELADQVVFEFPGKETDVTNTAVLTINNFTVQEISDPIEQWPAELDTELPASLTIDLTYNGTSIAGAQFDASYQSNGMPTQVVVELFVDDFTFTTTAIHSPYSNASWRNTLKFNEDILLETYIAANGNWSEDNIANNDTENGTYIENIINNANAHVIIMNLQVLGEVNIKGLGDGMRALEENQDISSEEEYYQAMADIINANANLIVIYRDSNTKIAEAEAYVDTYYDSYSDVTEYYLDMRFVYADGSAVDVETYVDTELDNFYTSVNNFIDQLNAEYDLNLEYIGPTSK
jgi:hypothetical protein